MGGRVVTHHLAPYPVPDELNGLQACAGANVDMFFPVTLDSRGLSREDRIRGRAQQAQAKAICVGCMFVSACLAYALDRPSEVGIWGATTDDERARLRRGRRAA